jgi:catechol 2,3-dioxygenase
VTNALYVYVRDPSGNRVELYHGDYSRDLDRPPIQWDTDDFREQGSNWCGTPAPPTWTQGTPILNEDWM